MDRVAGLFISTTHVTSKSSREEFVKTLTHRDVLLNPHFNGGIDVFFEIFLHDSISFCPCVRIKFAVNTKEFFSKQPNIFVHYSSEFKYIG
jgi:hypothetical protein